MQLNEMVPGLEVKLPPTDTRHRRDLRALEKGNYAKARAAFPCRLPQLCAPVQAATSPKHEPVHISLSGVVSSTAAVCMISICPLEDITSTDAPAQAAAAYGVLDKRWRARLKQHAQETGATSLPPTWFTLREPHSLKGPRGSLPRFRCTVSLTCVLMPS